MRVSCIYDCSKCVSDGRWESEQIAGCLGRCLMSGDPHLTTFDRFQYTVEGECKYILVKHVDPDESGQLVFIIQGTQHPTYTI